jgi:hypothetical protein
VSRWPQPWALRTKHDSLIAINKTYEEQEAGRRFDGPPAEVSQ